MKLQMIHLSDMHFSKKTDPFEIQIDKMIQALNSIENADECVIVISGDLAASGHYNEYRYVSSLIGAISKTLREEKFINKNVEVICVPGNHDIFFPKIDVSSSDNSDLKMDLSIYMKKYVTCMNGFFSFAHRRKCFLDDKIVSKKIIHYFTTFLIKN